jgi:hypothetical protein
MGLAVNRFSSSVVNGTFMANYPENRTGGQTLFIRRGEQYVHDQLSSYWTTCSALDIINISPVPRAVRTVMERYHRRFYLQQWTQTRDQRIVLIHLLCLVSAQYHIHLNIPPFAKA